jgi:hypothetical protein
VRNISKYVYSKKFNLRTSKPTEPLSEDEYPFNIPTHWRWERLDNIACYIQRGKGPKYANKSDVYVVSQKCIRWARFDLTPARFIETNALETYGDERYLQYGDLLWNSTGTGTVGRVAIYDQDDSVKAVADSHVTVIRLANVNFRYIWFLIATPWVQERIDPQHEDSIVSGTTNQVELSASSVKALQVPCPPLEEQKRIVAKVDALMNLCDQLEKLITGSQDIAKELAKAAIASITGTKIKEDEKMKTPKTELVSKLKLKVSPNNKDQAPLSAILAKHNGELSSKALWNYSGLEIDAFYQQLKTEMARDWIVEPEKARMIEKDADNQSEAEAG